MQQQGDKSSWDVGNQQPIQPVSQRIYGLVDPKELQRKQQQQQQQAYWAGRQYAIPTTNNRPKPPGADSSILSIMYPVSSGTEHRRMADGESSSGIQYQYSSYYGQQPGPSAPIQELIKRRQDLVSQSMAAPNNYLTQLALQDCEAQINQWAAINKQPGVFYGSTDAPICNRLFEIGTNSIPEGMSRRQYNKTQPWLTKNSLKAGSKIASGVGKNLLVRMGWREGFGLGKVAGGSSEPVVPEHFRGADRRGLSSDGETPAVTIITPAGAGPASSSPLISAPKTIVQHPASGKHPVSMLMEVCAKNHFPAPEFSEVLADGPSHRPHFIMRVRVNGTDYQPTHASSTKKDAKIACAIICLAALGLWESPSSSSNSIQTTTPATILLKSDSSANVTGATTGATASDTAKG